MQAVDHYGLIAVAAAALASYAAARLALRRVVRLELERRDVTGVAAVEAFYKPLEYVTVSVSLLAAVYAVYRDYLAATLIAIVAGAAIASAIPVMANLAAYYVIVMEYRLRVGDVISLPGGPRGRVVRVTPLFVAVRGREGHLAIIPNRVLVTTAFHRAGGGPATLRVRVTLSTHRGLGPALEDVTGVEARIREALQQRRLIQRAQDVTVAVNRLEPGRAVLDIVVTLSSPELRVQTANTIVRLLAEALAEYDPVIEVAEPM